MPLARLNEGLETLAIALDATVRARLISYLNLLRKWNKVHNLTAVRDTRQMVTQHLLDCLAVLPHVHGTRIADVGSGGGLPGAVFAIARPDWHVALIDSNHKKAAFLRQAGIELGLGNIEVVTDRVEAYRPEQLFTTVISRAFADIPEFLSLAGHLVAKDGVALAMKGVYPYEELAQMPKEWVQRQVIELAVPGLDARRHLVVIGRAA